MSDKPNPNPKPEGKKLKGPWPAAEDFTRYSMPEPEPVDERRVHYTVSLDLSPGIIWLLIFLILGLVYVAIGR